jgi:hypothetical protein
MIHLITFIVIITLGKLKKKLLMQLNVITSEIQFSSNFLSRK